MRRIVTYLVCFEVCTASKRKEGHAKKHKRPYTQSLENPHRTWIALCPDRKGQKIQFNLPGASYEMNNLIRHLSASQC